MEDRIERRVTTLVEEKLEGTDCFLVEIKQSPGKIVVLLDADSGLTIETCGKVSRFLEHHLEEEGLVGEKYVLEVSSPGLDQPLKLYRQYQKNIGREVDLLMEDGSKREGTLLEVAEDSIVINEIVKVKPTKREARTVLLENILKTKVKVNIKK